MKHEDRRFTANWINCHNLVKMKKMSFKSKCTDKTRVLRNCSTALWRQTLRSYSVTHAELGSHKLNQNITICFFLFVCFSYNKSTWSRSFCPRRNSNQPFVNFGIKTFAPLSIPSCTAAHHQHQHQNQHLSHELSPKSNNQQQRQSHKTLKLK